MPSELPHADRHRALRQGILLARFGIGAWAVVIVAGLVLVALLRPWYLWAVLVGFGILRLVLDVRRLRSLRGDLDELDDGIRPGDGSPPD